MGDSQGSARQQRVLVELRAPKSQGLAFAFRLADNFSTASFRLDSTFDPVVVPARRDQLPLLDVTNEEVVILRGTIDENKIEELRAQPNIIAVYPDVQVAPFGHHVTVKASQDLSLIPAASFSTCPIEPCDCQPEIAKGTIADVASYLGADQIWGAGYRGEGMVVGLVDGGIAALGRTPIPGETARIPRVIDGWPTDDWGTTSSYWNDHGNMSATDVLGIAPQAQLYDIRISDGGSPTAWLSNALAGYQWAIDKYRTEGRPQILSNSWGLYQESWGPDYASNPDHPFTRKVIEAIEVGIIVLFAAGNCGGACPSGKCGDDVGPGKSIWGANGHPLVITVGATNKNERLAGYSSQGPAALAHEKPDFCSITHFQGYTLSDSGTSSATPVAAGLVALLKQANPALNTDQAKSVLRATAKDLGQNGWDAHSGTGVLQGKAAFDLVTKQGTWSGWASRDGLFTSPPTAVSWGPNRLDIFAKGTDNSLQHRAYDSGGWGAWESLGSVLTSPPAAVSWGPSRLDVFVLGRENALWHRAYDSGGWGAWESLGGVLTSPPAAVSWGPSRLDVFAKGTDNSLQHRVYDSSGWGAWEALGGVLTSPPAAVSWGPSRLDLFAKAIDNSVQHRAYDSGTWGAWESLGGVLTSPPAAVTWGAKKLAVFALGVDNAVWRQSWS
jgi:serine protease AprX